MRYRREIDGLRALAVIPVILFHAGIDAFSGGYVGVDVFFVISGYLITGIILEELYRDDFSILNFYERRARRILPALFFVLFVSLIPAWIWLTPIAMADFSKSLASVSLFSSNIYFWRSSGYFDQASELRPLLHTWSLAVEEQFYLLFPLFLIVVWRWIKGKVLGLIILVASISFFISLWATVAKPGAAFFLLPTRGWELLLGAIVAFLHSFHIRVASGPWAGIGGIVGLFLIAFAVFYFDHETSFPGIWVLMPTLGTVLVILCTSTTTLSGKILGHSGLVGIGLISYSAYLWHQVIFAFVRYNYAGEIDPAVVFLLILVVFLMAFFTWHFIEKPFRNRKFLKQANVFYLSLIGLCFFLTIGLTGYFTDGYRYRLPFPPNIKWMSLGDRLRVEGDVCNVVSNAQYPSLKSCIFGDKEGTQTLVLYGDSHAQSISRELDKQMSKLNYKVIKVEMTGCAIVFDITTTPVSNPQEEYKKCNQKFREMQRLIRDHKASVLLVTRWTSQFFPIPGILETLPFNNGKGGIESTGYKENVALDSTGTTSKSAADKKASVVKLLNGLQEVSDTLYVSYPIPEIGWNIYKVNLEHFIEKEAILQDLYFPYDLYLKRNRFILDILEEWSQGTESTIFLRPDNILCDSMLPDSCVAQKAGVPFYYDDDHLSDEGAELLVDEFAKSLQAHNQPVFD